MFDFSETYSHTYIYHLIFFQLINHVTPDANSSLTSGLEESKGDFQK